MNIDQRVVELKKKQELLLVLKALDQANIKVLLYKGTALAYSLYKDPSERRRLDHDILVSDNNHKRAAKILSELGYIEYQQLEIFNERCFVKKDEYNINHVIDLHWKLSNRSFIARLFLFEELWNRSEKLEKLLPNTRRLSNEDQFIATALHEVYHHYSKFSEESLCDGQLMLNKMSLKDKLQLREKVVGLGLSYPINLYIEALECKGKINIKKFKTKFFDIHKLIIHFGKGPYRWMLIDLFFLKGFKAKSKYIIKTLFPNTEYTEFHNTSNMRRMLRAFTSCTRIR